MRNQIVSEIFKESLKNRDIFTLTGDLGYGLFEPFMEKLPKQFINVGVSEQNMITVAAGLAKEGKKVFVYSISNFASLRCVEQIRNDICYHNLDVNILSNGAGYSYGPLGFSHHGTEDIAIMRSLPGLNILSPGTTKEATLSVKQCLSSKKPHYLRIDKSFYDQDEISFSKSQGKIKILLLSTGSIGEEAYLAAEEIYKSKKEIEIEIISIWNFNDINVSNEYIKHKVLEADYIVTLEEHNISGGFGSYVLENYHENLARKKIKILGIENKLEQIVGSQNYLRKINHLDKKSIVKSILDFISD